MVKLAARVLYEQAATGLTLASDFGVEGELYRHVTHVRAHGKGDIKFKFDRYSNHYVLYHHLEPIGTMTATRAVDGEMDCQQYYPSELLDRYGDLIASACKFRITSTPISGLHALRLMIREIWRDQIRDGFRLDMINAKRKHVPFYRRIGYQEVGCPSFTHPIFGDESVVMVLPADPNHRSFCQDLFQDLDSPLLLRDVLETAGVSPQEVVAA